MNKLFLHRFYNKMLYFDAGVQLCLYGFNYYRNLINQEKAESFAGEKLHCVNCLLLNDFSGRCENFIYKYIQKLYMHKSHTFLIIDDCFGKEKFCGIYVPSFDITALSSCDGDDMSTFYYSTDRRKEKDIYYSKLALACFSNAGDYC